MLQTANISCILFNLNVPKHVDFGCPVSINTISVTILCLKIENKLLINNLLFVLHVLEGTYRIDHTTLMSLGGYLLNNSDHLQSYLWCILFLHDTRYNITVLNNTSLLYSCRHRI